MFAVPPDISTTVFARLSGPVAVTKGTKLRYGHRRGSFLEGTSFDGEGNLRCVDLRYGRIFVADHKHGLMLLDPGSGRITPLLDQGLLERFRT